MKPQLEAFDRLLTIMDELRVQCPWDRKQTMESLRNLTIEETYELADAILEKDLTGVKEEIGDLLLHMVFYAKIADEQKEWDISDALNAVCDKLINRHPHIYGDVTVEDEEEVKRNWEQIKQQEGKGKRSVLGGVPKSLPAMVKHTCTGMVTAQLSSVVKRFNLTVVSQPVKRACSDSDSCRKSGLRHLIEGHFPGCT